MTSLAEGLIQQGVSADRVHYESFGGESFGGDHQPAVKSTPIVSAIAVDQAQDVIVVNGDDRSRLQWNSTNNNLLDFVDANGIEWNSGCRVGQCGACVCKLLHGNVTYNEQPEFEAESDEIVTCMARPADDIEIEIPNP